MKVSMNNLSAILIKTSILQRALLHNPGSGHIFGPFRPLHVTPEHKMGAFVSFGHRIHTEWQWPLSDVYSIMMEKSAQPMYSVQCWQR
jgi:hypothetical protein